jgi:hypothetical protein
MYRRPIWGVDFLSNTMKNGYLSVAGAGSDGVDCTGVAGADSGAGVDSFANSSAANS